MSGKSKQSGATFLQLCGLVFLSSILFISGCSSSGGGGGNKAPVATDVAVTTDEDTSTTGTLSATDANAKDTLTYSIVTNGTKGTATITDAATGAFSYVPNANANGDDTFTYIANDGKVDSNEATVTVTITAVNDLPMGTADSYTTTEGVNLVATAANGVLANDTDDDGEILTAVKVADPTNGTLTLNSDGSFTYVPDVNFSGADSFTYQANDATVASATVTVSITVTAVNSAPSFTKGANQTVNEDAGAQTVAAWATAISAGAGDTGQTVSFNVTNDNNALFSVQPAVDSSGQLTYTPAANANGSALVDVVAMDDGGTANGGVDTSAAQSFLITVTAVNDAPSFTKGADETVAEDAGAQTVPGWATAISKGPADEAGDVITGFNVSNDNNALFSAQPAIDTSGQLTYTPAANAFGSATVTVSVSDDGGTANGGSDTSADQTFTITVTSVNDDPVANAGTDQTGVAEQSTVNLDGSGSSDVDTTDVLLYTWSQTAGTTVFLSDASAQSPSFTAPAVTATTVLTFQLQVNDQNGGIVTDTVNISVDPASYVTGFVSDQPESVVLSDEGLNDHLHIGLANATDISHDAGELSDTIVITDVSTAQVPGAQYLDGPTVMSWTGAASGTASEAGTLTGVFYPVAAGNTGDGYKFDVTNVSTTGQTLRIYMGVFRATATVTASLNDGSGANWSATISNPVTDTNSQSLYKVVTINFAAASGTGHTLAVSVTSNADLGVASNVSLSALTLSDAYVTAPMISPDGGTGTDSQAVSISDQTPGSSIYYTTDGSTPTTGSTLYSGAFNITSTTTVKALAVKPGYVNSSVSSATITMGTSSNGAQLAGRIERAPVQVDLTAEGTVDWAHWGVSGTTMTEKSGGTAIGAANGQGTNVTNGQFPDNAVAFSWTDGTAQATASDVITGVFYLVTDANFVAGTQGYSVSITPGDTNSHTARLYMGAYQATATITATLNGAQTYTGTVAAVDDADAGAKHRVVVFDFAAASASDSLVINVLMTSKGSSGLDMNTTLEAVSLQ